LIAIASVILVITPISWILLHQPQNDSADASIPIVTRTDDTYITPTTKPVVAPTTRASTPPTATPTATPTQTPTDSVTPTTTPSTTESTESTATPTTDRSSKSPTAPPDDPTTAPTQRPTATTPPPPADDGSMNSTELALFNLIDNARTNQGCAPLKRDSDITSGARGDAASRARSGSVNYKTGSMSAAGGDKWTAQKAFDQMMSQSRSTVLNCGLTTLGVGFGTAEHCTVQVLVCLGKADRNAWVADFS